MVHPYLRALPGGLEALQLAQAHCCPGSAVEAAWGQALPLGPALGGAAGVA